MDLSKFFRRIVLGGVAFLIFSLAACAQLDDSGEGSGDGDAARFYALSADGKWAEHDGSALPEDELLLEADADGNGMLRGDTVKVVGWNSEKDGTGDVYAEGASGDWYARYEVAKCTVWFDASGLGVADPEPASASVSGEWKVEVPAVQGAKKHFRVIWYSDADFTEPFDFANDEVRHSVTLYAGWESPLCLTALADDCSVALKKNHVPADILLEYSLDGGANWTDYTIGNAIDLNDGESVYFSAPASNASFSISDYAYYYFDLGGDADKKIAVSGNVMSLLDGTLTLKDLSGKNYVFFCLFRDCNSLVSVSVLPATTLAGSCYSNMFCNCSSLEVAPSLPAETLAESCYNSMFYGCSSLEVAPSLPAETLAEYCYVCMFRECASLETAPKLPAETLVDHCYSNMFQDCKSLMFVPDFFAKTLAPDCCYGMFASCSSLETAPVLLAETLAPRCYFAMFDKCLSLKDITVKFLDWNVDEATYYWMYKAGESASGTKTFHCPSGLTATRGESHIPDGWNIDDAVVV